MTTERKTYSITKATLNELVTGLNQDTVNSLFVADSGKPAPMQSKTKLIQALGLTGAKKKAVEEYAYPTKRKPRKTVVKAGTSSTTVSKDDYKEFTNDKLINSIKEYKNKLKAMEDQLADRLK